MPEAAQLASKLQSEGEKFSEFFSGLNEDQWSTEVYAEGSVWTIRSILAHLMTAERAFVRLFEEIRRGGEGVSEDFEIDRYNARQQEKTRDQAPAELLEQYRSVRAQMVTWVSGLQDAELECRGRHPFLGETTLREMIKLIYIHNQTHYRDIRRVTKG
ncbi:MAG TPA: DinB family protein [Anaerolineales bacterium]|nr:DinB family protein [Anaerolineales bacterium]